MPRIFSSKPNYPKYLYDAMEYLRKHNMKVHYWKNINGKEFGIYWKVGDGRTIPYGLYHRVKDHLAQLHGRTKSIPYSVIKYHANIYYWEKVEYYSHLMFEWKKDQMVLDSLTRGSIN